MFSRKIIILKSEFKEFSNLVFYFENNNGQIKGIIKSEISLLNSNSNVFCIVLSQNNNYEISRLKKSNEHFDCVFENEFNLDGVSIFIVEHLNNSFKVLAQSTNSKSSEFEHLLISQRTNLANKMQSLLSFTPQSLSSQNLFKTVETKSNNISSEYFCDKTGNICFYKREYHKLINKIADMQLNTKDCQNDECFDVETQYYSQCDAYYEKENTKQKEEQKTKMEEENSFDNNIKENEEKKDIENVENEQPEAKLDFYQQIEKTMSNLFETKQPDDILENFIEDSKFVKVEYEETNDYYSVGIIFENGNPKYICYALPCSEGSPPPENLAEFAQYLPIGNQKGYYLMYQDAKTGENIVIQSI